MQKGFVTFEIIFITLIIALLASAAIPNAVRMIDQVALDYETKKLYTDLRLLQSLERNRNLEYTHFNLNDGTNPICLTVYPERYVFRRISDSKIFREHYFSYGVTADKKSPTEIWQIKFDDTGRVKPAISDSLRLTSRLQKNSYIVFDSVGRFRGGRTDEQSE